MLRLPGRIDDVMQSTVRLDRSIRIDRTDRERSLQFLRDRKAELGERLSKLRQQKEMLKLEEQQLKFQEEQLMVENNQLASEEDLLLNEISRSELERSVLNLFPETCAGLSAGNRAQSLFENRTETVQVLPSPQDKSTSMNRDTVATMLQPVAVAQKFQACKAPDNVISDPSRDDINRVPSPLFTASYARVPATNLPDYVARSNVEHVHVTERDIDVPSRMRNYDWAVGPQSQTRAPASSYPRQYQPIGVLIVCDGSQCLHLVGQCMTLVTEMVSGSTQVTQLAVSLMTVGAVDIMTPLTTPQVKGCSQCQQLRSMPQDQKVLRCTMEKVVAETT